MENAIHSLTLDLTGPDMRPVVEVRKDNARTLVIALTQGGRPYWIAEGVTAVFSARKPDGMPLFNGCTIEKNRVRYDFTDQTTNVAGIVACEILLYSGDEKILSSPKFELLVDDIIHQEGDVPESAPEISALTKMVAAGTAMLEDLREALAGLEGVEEILTQARAAAEAAASAAAAAQEYAEYARSREVEAAEQAARAENAAVLAMRAYEEAEQAYEESDRMAGRASTAADRAEAAAKRAEEAATGGNGSGQNPGQDGFSPIATVTQTADGATISITDKNGTTTATVTNGKDGKDGVDGKDGAKGDKGDKGDTGATGPAGADGAKGDKGDKGDTGAQGDPGKDGANGKDGVSATHSWNGTTLTITSASGTSSANLKGAKGDKGDTGATGAAGADGLPGTDGINGADGYTPVLGVDYWTSDDIAEIEAHIATELAKRGQLEPLYADSIEKCTDTTKLYVLPDGFIYAWMLTEKEVESGPAYTNLLPLAKATDRTTIYNSKGYKENTKLSGSGGGESTAGTGKEAMCSSGFIFPVAAGDKLRIKGIAPVSGSNHYVVGYDASNARTGNDTILFGSKNGSLVFVDTGTNYSGKYTIDDDGTIVYTINTAKLGANVNAIRICAAMDENTIVTLNEEIKEGGGTTIVKEYAWTSTGHAFVPANYEPRIIALEEKTAQNTADISALKKGSATATPIKTWDAPIYDANIPVFQLSAEKAAITSAEKTVSAVYAKYDALMAKHPNYITKTNLGMCSDGVTPVYRYDFREPEPHRGVTGAKEWSETKAKAIIVSGIHWEWGGIFSLYNALEELADNPALFHLRRNTHLIVLPVCNPYAVANMSVRNANQVEIHRNFEVDFIYPGEPGYIEIGERSHGGTAPLSEVETQYIDNIFKANTDAVFFLTCHSNQSDSVYGTGFTWASPATYYMCNMHYRLVDKLSKVWMDKYGEELAAGIADYRTENTPEWDNRLGSAYLSTTNGTETKQATKYGIQATNIEVTDAFLVHGTKANPEPALSSFTMSRGAEVYVNFLLTAFGVYDPKDKKEYAPATV